MPHRLQSPLLPPWQENKKTLINSDIPVHCYTSNEYTVTYYICVIHINIHFVHDADGSLTGHQNEDHKYKFNWHWDWTVMGIKYGM